jgi:hypothetical protein
MADPNGMNYQLGAVRHVASIGNISQPPEATQRSITTGHLLLGRRGHRGGAAAKMAGPRRG